MFVYQWKSQGRPFRFEMIDVEGTHGQPYGFGDRTKTAEIEVKDFSIGRLSVTPAFWIHVMGEGTCPMIANGPDLPVENVSWDGLHATGGFLERLNGMGIREGSFRLPTETEWEYAARGGTRWKDGFRFSGSNDVEAVAWYDRRHGDWTMPVGKKAPNQLGLFDMSGNVWEWCEDVYTERVDWIPRDGTAYRGPGERRILRGGCFHNWAIHCTVSKRYEIESDAHDGCIGFRLVCA